MSTEVNLPIAFGPFQLDPEAHALFRDGQPVPITPKVFDALLLLVQSSGKLVSKEDLMKALWPDSFVCESNLTQTVFMVRKALGKNEAGENYIVNVPGRGYRFVPGAIPLTVPVSAPDVALPVAPELGHGGRWKWSVALLAICLLAASIVGAFRWSRSRVPAMGGRVVIAVLPFENLTGDAGQEYLSDGFTDEMIAKLGRLDSQKLGVIGRTSVMHYKKTSESIDSIGRELGAQYLLEGSVRRDGSKVRITADLIQVRDQTHVWAEQYDRELGEMLVVEDEITQKIADEIQAALGGKKRVRPQVQPASPAAYDAYLQGLYFWNKRTPDGLRQSVRYFQRAVETDRSYARAYAGLADSYAMMSDYEFLPVAEAMPKARAAALEALRIDDSLAEAHTSMAAIAQNYDWDWQTAEKEYRRAIQLDPNYATAHHWYSEFLALQGRFDEALAESERARQLDPLSLIIASDSGAIYYFSHRYDQAIERFRGVLEMEPSFPRAHLVIAAYVKAGRMEDALSEVHRWHQSSDSPWVWAWEVYVDRQNGDRQRAKYAYQQMQKRSRAESIQPPAMFAIASLGMNDREAALRWLEKSIAARTNTPTQFKVDPLYDPLRGDPRFQEMLRRVHLQ